MCPVTQEKSTTRGRARCVSDIDSQNFKAIEINNMASVQKVCDQKILNEVVRSNDVNGLVVKSDLDDSSSES